jgi:hypothetical protein
VYTKDIEDDSNIKALKRIEKAVRIGLGNCKEDLKV